VFPVTGSISLPTLNELVRTITNSTGNHNYTCPKRTTVFPDTPLLPIGPDDKEKKIPRIVHVTGKTRCVPKSIYKHLQKWKLKGHGLYFHDDEAVHRLLKIAVMDNDGRGLVPDMERVLSCITSGATLSDIWRYTLMWYYGGIYTDLDNSPNKFNGNTIQPEDDSFFPLESLGIVSQYFIASSPRHPLMLHTLNEAIYSLYKTVNVMINNPAINTGPKAMKAGFIRFQNAVAIPTGGYVDAGVYYGAFFDTADGLRSDIKAYVAPEDIPVIGNRNTTNPSERRSVRVVGHKGNSQEYVNRTGLQRKGKAMQQAGMSNYHSAVKKNRWNKISCKGHIAREEDRIKKMLNETTVPPATASYVTAHQDWYPRFRRANYVQGRNGESIDANDT
jgi:hypothetical protein